MALHRYGDFRVEVFYFDSPCTVTECCIIAVVYMYMLSNIILGDIGRSETCMLLAWSQIMPMFILPTFAKPRV